MALVAAAFLTFTSGYYLSVLLIGRWWGPPGKLASGRRFTSLPVRVVAALYLGGLICVAVSAWADAMPEQGAWVPMLLGAGVLILMLTFLAEGLLPKWRSAPGSGRSNAP